MQGIESRQRVRVTAAPFLCSLLTPLSTPPTTFPSPRRSPPFFIWCQESTPLLHSTPPSSLPSLPEHSCVFIIRSREIRSDRPEKKNQMADWGPVVVGVVLFILLTPGLLFEMPGSHHRVDFGGLHTNGKAIFVHTILFFAAFTILTLALHIHIYAG